MLTISEPEVLSASDADEALYAVMKLAEEHVAQFYSGGRKTLIQQVSADVWTADASAEIALAGGTVDDGEEEIGPTLDLDLCLASDAPGNEAVSAAA
jgi:hypothetical protein